jgi:glycogen debranching enzyme
VFLSDRTDLSRALIGKAADTFAVTGADGGVPLGGGHPFGVFRDDARHLSGRELRIDGEAPVVEASGEESGAVSWSQLRARAGLVRLVRTVLGDGRVEERLLVDAAAPVTLELALDADFEPMLVLRGAAEPLPPVQVTERARPDGLELRGRGRDGVVRVTCVRTRPAPEAVDGRVLRVRVAPGDELVVTYDMGEEGSPDVEVARPRPTDAAAAGFVSIRADDPALDAVLDRAQDDLETLRTPFHDQAYPAAGVPWYVALFGRDSLITVVQAAPFLGGAAASTLRLLARHVGTATDPAREEEPGKVPHELRSGELARLGAAPLARYYGSVDATPLFLCALAEETAWSGSLALADELAAAADATLAWTGDRLLTYTATPAGGLRHQGWKDSPDGLPGEDGRQPADPVAVVEAQGYALAARRAAARMADAAGDATRAGRLRQEADALAAVLERFWLADRGWYAMALGGDGRPLRSLGSNQGHLLWARAVTPERAAAVRDALLGPAMWSGWGVRTLAAGERAYDPASYHRGSVWPHDTALFAAGLRAYGFDDAFARVCDGLLDAAAAFPAHRLPELFAGTPREEGVAPATYPSACRPQAWAAGTVLLLLRTALGLEPDGPARRLVVRRPLLPGRASEIELSGLHVAGARVDLRFARSSTGAVEVLADAASDELTVDVVPAA